MGKNYFKNRLKYFLPLAGFIFGLFLFLLPSGVEAFCNMYCDHYVIPPGAPGGPDENCCDYALDDPFQNLEPIAVINHPLPDCPSWEYCFDQGWCFVTEPADCQRGSFANILNISPGIPRDEVDGLPCSIQHAYWSWGCHECVKEGKYDSGGGQSAQVKCVVCDGPIEIGVLGTRYEIYGDPCDSNYEPAPGNNRCSAACGADLECDEELVGASCGTSKVCNDSCQCITSVVSPTVTTNNASSIGQTSAYFNGYLNDDGGEACRVRFEWWKYGSAHSYTTWTGYSYNIGEPFSSYKSGLEKGRCYHYMAQAQNSAGSDTDSPGVKFLTYPDPPYNVEAIPQTADEIRITWSKGSGASDSNDWARIRRRENLCPTSLTSGSFVSDEYGTSYTDTGLTPGIEYCYSLWSGAVDGDCNSVYSTSYECVCVAGCNIGGTLYEDEECNPSNKCQYCDVLQDTAAWSDVPSGKVCYNDNLVNVSDSSGRYCYYGENCDSGDCSAQEWWTSCNGLGFCRSAGSSPPAGSYSETVYASAGYSLTSSCGTTGSMLCGSSYLDSSGPGDNHYGDGGTDSCQGMCDSSGHCDYAVNCTSSNNPPSCTSLGASPQSGSAPLSVIFTGSGNDTDGTIVSYQWDFNGDGTWDQTTAVNNTGYTYSTPGDYTAKLRVQDDDGAWSSTPPICTKTISVAEPGESIDLPIVETLPIDDSNHPGTVTIDSATVLGKLISCGGADNCLVWFGWGTSGTSGDSDSYGNEPSYQTIDCTTVSFPYYFDSGSEITGLTPGTTYYFEAFAKNGGSW